MANEPLTTIRPTTAKSVVFSLKRRQEQIQRLAPDAWSQEIRQEFDAIANYLRWAEKLFVPAG